MAGIAGAAGAYVGSVTGVGAAKGFAIGASLGFMIGSYLFPDGPKMSDKQGPGLNENRVQISSYGVMLAKIWGSKRVAGNVIWMTDVKEDYSSKKQTERSYHMVFGVWGFVIAIFLLDPVIGMMWNPWKKTDAKWYEKKKTYTCSFAIAFCEGPVSSITRLWMDNTLWADFRNPDGASYPPQSGDIAKTNYDRSLSSSMGYVMYYGDESQQPDPTIEAAMGVGNTPAYRGVCYIVVKNFPVGYFSSIPTFEAEIVKTGTTSLVAASISFAPAINGRPTNQVASSTPWTIDGNYVIGLRVYEPAPSSKRVGSELVMMHGFSNTVAGRMAIPLPDVPREIRNYTGDAFNDIGELSGWGINPDNGEIHVCTQRRYGTGYGLYIRREMIFTSFGGDIKIIDDGDDGKQACDFLRVVEPSYSPVLYWTNFWWTKGQKWAQSFLYYGGWRAGYGIQKIDNDTFGYPSMVTSVQAGLGQYYGGYPVIFYGSAGTGIHVNVQAYNGTWYWMAGGHLDSGDKNYIYFCSGTYIYPIFSAANEYFTIRVDPNRIYWQDGGVNVYVPWGSFERIRSAWSDAYPFQFSNGVTFPTTVWGPYLAEPIVLMENVTNNVTYKRIWQNKTAAPLSLVATEICGDAGIASQNLDVTDLTDEIDGYAITRQMPARTALEPLLPAFCFDVAEIDWKLHFVKRGSASVATILTTELGAVTDGEKPTGNQMIERRLMSNELPTHLSLNYESTNRDYDVTVQRAARTDKNHYLPMDVTTPVVMSDTKAIRQAEIILNSVWTARTKYEFSTLKKYCYLSPCKVITVGGKQMRIAEMQDRDNAIDFMCESESSGSYVSTAVSGTLQFVQPVINKDLPAPIAFLADLPAMQISDLDTPFGFYAGMSGMGTDYRGGFLESFDINNGDELGPIETFDPPKDPFGFLSFQLRDGIMNCFDYTHSITVSFPIENFVLSNFGESSQNYAAIGNETDGYEIIQYLTATLLSAGTYKLTGLCRGLFGTRRYLNTHGGSDLFIPLNDLSLFKRIALDSSYLNVPIGYVASNPSSIYSAIWSRDFTAAGNSSRPYPVSCIEGSRTEAGDLVIEWKREDRLFFTVDEFEEDDTDIPMSESVELYEVEVCPLASAEPLATYQTHSPALTIPLSEIKSIGLPYPIMDEKCDGVLTTNWIDNGWPNGSYAGHYSGMSAGEIVQLPYSGYSRSGCNLLARPLIPSDSVLTFEYQHRAQPTFTSGYFGKNESSVFIVKSNPTYNWADDAATFLRPEYGVGQNSFLALILAGGPTFYLVQRVVGITTLLATASAAGHSDTDSLGNKDPLLDSKKLIVDFQKSQISFYFKGVKIIDSVFFDPVLRAYLGPYVQINLHNTQYYTPNNYEYYDNLKISHSQSSATAPPRCNVNIYQMSSIVGRGHVATATV